MSLGKQNVSVSNKNGTKPSFQIPYWPEKAQKVKLEGQLYLKYPNACALFENDRQKIRRSWRLSMYVATQS